MKVKDLMHTEVVTMQRKDRLSLVDDVMRLGRIRHIPIVEGDKLAGIVSQRDLYQASLSSILNARWDDKRDWLDQVELDEVMVTRVITTTPEESLALALEKMIESKIGCLPVVEGDRLVGLITETDFMRFVKTLLRARDVRDEVLQRESGDTS